MENLEETKRVIEENITSGGSAGSAVLDRDRQIVRTSVVGIIANIFLAGFKTAVGLLSHSIAIVLDAVNNLSDASSSLITIIGTKLAAKKPDRKHPFGHGRVEYFSAMIISFIVLYAGITSLVESVKKIIDPEIPDYSIIMLAIVAAGVVVKILLGRYVSGKGRKLNSDSLVNSGKDATLDAVISASTLVAAVLNLWRGWRIEAWLGAVISLIIVKSGIEMLRETISKILGERIDSEMARSIKETVMSFPGVSGAYDLVLNNYGPNYFNGSVHIEVPDTYTAEKIDELIREITMTVYMKHNVILTAIGVYSVNTHDENIVRMRERIREEVMSVEHVLQMHGFFVNEEKKTIRFDVVLSFEAEDRSKVQEEICRRVAALYPDYKLQTVLDTDFSESE